MIGSRAAIAVLGPADSTEPDRMRTTAAGLGEALARQGYAVLVEGSGLVAEATATGARAAGGTVEAVGYPDSPAIELPGVERMKASSSLKALDEVLTRAEAVILMPGGLPAVAVLTQIWCYGHTPNAPYRQTILMGNEWPARINALADALNLDQRTRAMVTFAGDVKEAVEALRYYVAATGNGP